MNRFFRFLIPFGALGATLAGVPVLAADTALDVSGLQVDGMTNPMGLDSSRTYLSWKLESEQRGARQSAWQVLAASSRELLDSGEGDLWNTGKREGADQVQVRYRGQSVGSGEEVFWKVRVWDQHDQPSDWSEPATWTTGVRSADDWQAAWITHPRWLEVNREHLGYRSLPADEIETEKWLQLDLGRTYPVESIRLRALRHTVAERLGFPTKFVLEIAKKADFSDAVVVADTTDEPKNEWLAEHAFEVDSVDARYVRVTAPELRKLNGEICLAFSQIEVHAGGENVAVGAEVSASDSFEEGPWSAAAVVDGKGVPGTNPLANKTVLVRKEFPVEAGLKRAVVHASGLGGYTMSINGHSVGDRRLSPGWTDATQQVLYDTFDVTDLLTQGANAIGMTLASSMYSVSDPDGRYTKFIGRFRPLLAIAQLRLEYADGRVEVLGTDETWQTRPGPVTYSHVYGGEDYDARLEPEGWSEAGFTGSGWKAVAVTDGPGGWLRGASHAAPPVRSIEEIEPVSQNELSPETTVFDLGQNASLMVRIAARGPAGSRVRVTPAELIDEEGRIDRSSCGGGSAWWQLTLAGTGETEVWEPDFFYHGSRYLQVEVFPAEEGEELPVLEEITGIVTHSSAPPVGEFASSSDLFNEIRTLIRWAQRSNMVSVLTDCPHRERLGWLEQYHLNGPSLRYEFNLSRLFNKTFGDMADAQTEEGLVPDIAPEFIVFPGDFRDSPEWGSSLILAAWQQYLFTGDDSAFLTSYNPMQDYFKYLAGKAEGHILDHGLGDWYDLGPDSPGYSQLTPIALTATATYYQNAWTLSKIAAHRTRWGEAAAYAERAEHIKQAFNAKFFDSEKGSYATGSQTSNAMPYALGMVPEGYEDAVLAAIVADVREQGNQFTSGDVGHRYLLMALAKGGRSDVIFDMHHQTDRPGYGFQLEQGATSLTEAWNARRHSSHNHFMLGHIMEWFYHDLVGIAPDPEQPGFENVIVKPQPVGELTWAEATHDSVRGPVHVRWERDETSFSLDLEVPANATATVYLPTSDADSVRESNARVDEHETITFLREENGRAVYSVQSGTYFFRSAL